MSKLTIDRSVLEHVLNAILNAVPQTTSQAKEQLESLLVLRGALAQPQQEPVFWVRLRSDGLYEGPIHNNVIEDVRRYSGAWTPLYTSPPASTATSEDVRLARKPLPAHEIVTLYEENPRSDSDMIDFARAVEAAHGIK